MKKIIFALFALIMVSSGCSQNNIIVDNPPQKEIIPTTIVPTSTKTLIQPTKTLKPSVTPTINQPENIEINLFSPDLLNTAPDRKNPDFSIEDIKAEIYFTGGAGGRGAPCYLEKNEKIPAIAYGRDYKLSNFCIIGFSNNSEISIKVLSPTNEIVSTFSFDINQNSEIVNLIGLDNLQRILTISPSYVMYEYNDVISVDYYNEVRSTASPIQEPMVFLNLWFPEIPQLYGKWKIQAVSEDIILEKTITLSAPNYPTIQSIPNLPYNPIKTDLSRYTFNTGDQIIIIGTGFEKSTEYNIGIYRFYENRKVESIGFFANAANLIFAKHLYTSEIGEFYIKFNVNKEDLAGGYNIIPNTNGNFQASYNILDSDFLISNQTNLENYSLTFECTGSVPSRLTVGDFAFVSADPPDANTVRKGPAIKESKVGKIQPLEKIEILDGPKCVDNFIWWEIRSLSTGLSGWTAEGNSTTYWLVPMK